MAKYRHTPECHVANQYPDNVADECACNAPAPPARETWKAHANGDVSDGRGGFVATTTDYVNGRAGTRERAESIARDHNAVGALREALQEAKRALCAVAEWGGYPNDLDATIAKSRAALAQAGE